MNGVRDVSRAGAKVEWHVRLECGHEIAVPWGYASPAVMACIVQHRDRCETPAPDLSGMAWWAAPLGRAPLPAFR
jgi:hypothetical protein